MSKFKGTNGRWELVKDKMIDSKKADYLILTTGVESKNLFRSIDCSSVSKEEMEANAKLIAAAPVLLEALKILLIEADDLYTHVIDQNFIDSEDEPAELMVKAIQKAREIIQKATE